MENSLVNTGGSSQLMTPPAELELEKSLNDGGIVSGKGILPQVLRKRKKLKPFDKPIPENIQARFSDLKELHAKELNDFTRSLPDSRGIFMRLKVLGENEESAEPWVYVQCDERISSRVRRFFKKSSFMPNLTKLSPRPRIQVIVCSLDPTMLTGNHIPNFWCNTPTQSHDVRILGDERDISSGNLCGTRITHGGLVGNHRIGTMGGVIIVINSHFESTLYGMTARHFVLEESFEKSEDKAHDDPDDDFDSELDDFELDPGSFGSAKEGNEMDCQAKLDISVIWQLLGYLALTSANHDDKDRNLDWALTTIESLAKVVPNHFESDAESVGLTWRRIGTYVPSGREKEVAMLSTRGILRGKLSGSWSYMMLPPGKTLVRVYLFSLAVNFDFQPGDSGAWIVDIETKIVHGCIVASDVFGEGYVVPIADSFEDIKSQLSARAVTLPTMADIKRIKSKNRENRFELDEPQERPIDASSRPHRRSSYSSLGSLEVNPEFISRSRASWHAKSYYAPTLKTQNQSYSYAVVPKQDYSDGLGLFDVPQTELKYPVIFDVGEGKWEQPTRSLDHSIGLEKPTHLMLKQDGDRQLPSQRPPMRTPFYFPEAHSFSMGLFLYDIDFRERARLGFEINNIFLYPKSRFFASLRLMVRARA